MSDAHFCYSRLVAVGHEERLNSVQVHEGRVCYGRLPAECHVEILDPIQVHKCGIPS